MVVHERTSLISESRPNFGLLSIIDFLGHPMAQKRMRSDVIASHACVEPLGIAPPYPFS